MLIVCSPMWRYDTLISISTFRRKQTFILTHMILFFINTTRRQCLSVHALGFFFFSLLRLIGRGIDVENIREYYENCFEHESIRLKWKEKVKKKSRYHKFLFIFLFLCRVRSYTFPCFINWFSVLDSVIFLYTLRFW